MWCDRTMKQILTYEYQCTDFVFSVSFRCELMAVSLSIHCMFLRFPLRAFLPWITYFISTKGAYVKYIRLSPIISFMFRCLLPIFQGNYCVTSSNTVCFLQCCYIGCPMKCKIWFVFSFFFQFTMPLQCLKLCISSFCIVGILKS